MILRGPDALLKIKTKPISKETINGTNKIPAKSNAIGFHFHKPLKFSILIFIVYGNIIVILFKSDSVSIQFIIKSDYSTGVLTSGLALSQL